MKPEGRLPAEILEAADRVGIRTLGMPPELGPQAPIRVYARHPST
jgi:hypothetical protein